MAKTARKKSSRKTAGKAKRKRKTSPRKQIKESAPAPFEAPKTVEETEPVHSWENEEPQTELNPMWVPEQEGGEGFISKPVALAVSAILVICIIVLGILFVQSMKDAISSGAGPVQYLENDTSGFETLPPVEWNATGEWNDSAGCLQAYGLDPKTPIFSYLPTCPHCRTMLPMIQELMQGGHSFTLVDRTDPSNSKMLYACLEGVVGNSVPQLICPNTRRERTGTLTMNEITEFEQACRNS